MADAKTPFVRSPDLPPPASTVGVVGWLRRNLFSSWYNSVLTVLSLWLIWGSGAARHRLGAGQRGLDGRDP